MLAAHEAESRPLRYSSIPIIDYQPARPDGPVLAPPGSVMVFVGYKGAKRIAQIRDVVTSGSGTDSQLAEELMAPHRERDLLSPFKAWRLLEIAPVFAEIRYGGRTLAKNVFVPPDLDLVWVASPYNGGALSPGELTLVEHLKQEGSPTALEGLALRFPPSLTAAEQAAIQNVPADQLELNLAPQGACCDNVTDVLQVIIAVTFAIMCNNPFPDWHIFEEELNMLSPTVTAIRLMDIRREALGHEH
jgi:hypothetical protein